MTNNLTAIVKPTRRPCRVGSIATLCERDHAGRDCGSARSNNAVASGDEKVPRASERERNRKPERERERDAEIEEESSGPRIAGAGERRRANAEEELWERRENCKTTRRATAHAEGIIPRCGLKPRNLASRQRLKRVTASKYSLRPWLKNCGERGIRPANSDKHKVTMYVQPDERMRHFARGN